MAATNQCKLWTAKLRSAVVRRSLSLGCLLAATLPTSAALAQSEPISVDPLQPRWHLNYNSATSGRDRGITGVESFIPISQTPGQSVGYLVPRLGLDNNANLSGSALAGYRFLSGDTLLGGYAGLDFRNTGQSSFTQFAAGLEALGDDWDVSLNAYLPMGNTRTSIGPSTSVTAPRFQGNQLLLDTVTATPSEAALTGIDLDVGLRILDQSDTDESLWIRPGIYYYGGRDSAGSVGGRLSLDYRFQDNFQLGLGAQHDDLFGTNVFFSVNASLGSTSQAPQSTQAADESEQTQPDSPQSPETSLWARADESLRRNPSITVQAQTAIDTTSEVTINPVTGNAYTFLHVVPDSDNPNQGNGQLTSPFTTLGSRNSTNTTALGSVESNDIVYVRPGDTANNPISGFSIPANVQVLSSGVTHRLPIETDAGPTSVTVPSFGDEGTLPVISSNRGNAISINEANTVLAGFNIQNSSTGIRVDGANNTMIRDNIISLVAEDGAIVTNSPNTSFLNNQFIQTGDGGINISNSANNRIDNNQLTQVNGRGISVARSAGAIISNNRLNQTGKEGIRLDNATNSLVANNTVTRAGHSSIPGDSGISASGAVSNLTIRENIVQETMTLGAFFGSQAGIDLSSISGAVEVVGNTVTNTQIAGFPMFHPKNGGQGISLGNFTGHVDLTVSDNIIGAPGAGNVGDGIVIDLMNNATGSVNIQGNTIESNGTAAPQFGSQLGDGIRLVVRDSANLSDVNISDNQILSNLGDGINVRAVRSTGAQLRGNITGNTIHNHSNGQGIEIVTQLNGAGEPAPGTAQIVLGIQQNTLTENETDIQAVVDGRSPGGRLCLRVQDNANQDELNVAVRNSGTLQLEPVTGNHNNASAIAPNVAANTCNTP